MSTFGEIDLSKNNFKSKIGLEYVIETLKEFKKDNNKIPRIIDKEMNGRKRHYIGVNGMILE